MPRLTQSQPKYRKHKASGQAFVELGGKRHYLGPHGTKASRTEYDRLIGEWLAAGRPSRTLVVNDLSIIELCRSYWQFAKQHYRKDGRPTKQLPNVKIALRILGERYGATNAVDFGPLAMKAIQQSLIEQGNSRKYINDHTGRIKRVFKWGAQNELIPVDAWHRVQIAPGLAKGRTEAHETEPVEPVDDAIVEATLPDVSPVVADMVRFQRLVGCRPNEVCIVRPCDIDRSGDVWIYVPESHKTEHHNRPRVIMIGPKAQAILTPYLLREAKSYCFSAADSERKRRSELHANRKTPLSCGNHPGTNRRRKPKHSVGERYTVDSYRRAIHRACDFTFPASEPLAREDGESIRKWHRRLNEEQLDELKRWQSKHRWAPNQLRHTAGTAIRKQFGLEAAQVVLGHSKADTTQIYAERDLQKAAEIMREVG